MASARYLIRWTVLTAPMAVLVGAAVALFLWSLDAATRIREATPALLWLLPLAGIAIASVYARADTSTNRGNSALLDEINAPGNGLPLQMGVLVLGSTLVTHLFGGSAGREGTAVQMAGSIASALDRSLFCRLPDWMRPLREDRGVLLQASVAAGFGAVFGTPLAGAMFGVEVSRVGRLSLRPAIPCLVASLVADSVARWLGASHTAYPVPSLGAIGGVYLALPLLMKVITAGIAAGVVSLMFSRTLHALTDFFEHRVAASWLRPVIGGSMIIGLTLALGTRDYLGLGVTSPDPNAVTILSAFRADGASLWSWLLKSAFTVVTLGSGFKGGEVTPLFFIGATLGNSLATVLHAPVVLFAALGFVAVFCGATNTPIAGTIMGLELFGIDAGLYIATACAVSCLCSGHTGIYRAQRIERRKHHVFRWLSTHRPRKHDAGAATRHSRIDDP